MTKHGEGRILTSLAFAILALVASALIGVLRPADATPDAPSVRDVAGHARPLMRVRVLA